MEPATCAGLYPVPVPGDDVYKSLSDNSISCYEEMDVLSAPSVEEFIVDSADGCIGVR